MPLTVYQEQAVLASDDVRRTLRHTGEIPVDQVRLEAALIGPDGQIIPLSPAFVNVLQAAARLLLQGEGIVIVPADREMTTQEAADFLNMSRQYFVQLLERGDIPFTKTGTHRRVKFRDLLAYKERRDARGREIVDELTQLGQDAGDYNSRG